MVYGVGIDLIETGRMERELSRTGSRFAESVFTTDEIEYCNRTTSKNVSAQRFAGRFSAKEAFFKALGTGLRNGLRWQDVEVSHDELGKPYLVLKNRALELVREEKINNIQLSISHRENAVTAVVILEK